MTDVDLMIKFLLQAVVVLAACKAMGWIGKKYFGQTQVVMEMVTGIMLGPSLFGLYFPEVQSWIFPKAMTPDVVNAYLKPASYVPGTFTGAKHPSMLILYAVAQIGLVLYMFLVGLEFDTDLIKNRMAGAISTSIAGIIVPFILGYAIVEFWLKADPRFFGVNISQSTAALYLSAAMCITAFPTLARIIYERGLAGTTMGTLTLGAGATDDAVAWSLLAVVLASAKGDPNIAYMAIGGGTIFAILCLTLGKRLFVGLAKQANETNKLSNEAFAWTMMILMLGAFITDYIGIYAVFGAFLIGAAMPRGKFAEILREKLEYLTVGVFVPFFFVYSGLNTKVGLVNTPELWGITLAILVAAIFGKGVACTLAAKASGETWRDSWTIGTLMNARGMMELIILNFGLAAGVITPTLFTIMVLMAIITTLMASPIFNLIYRPPSAVPA